MRKQTLYRKFITTAIVFTLPVVLFVCGCDPQRNEDPVKVAEKHNDEKFNTDGEQQDAHFLEDAASMCLYEMKLNKLAQQNSIRADIQQKGKTLEASYARMYKSVMYLASVKTVTLPTDISDAQKKKYNDLSFEITKDFDKKYTELVMKDHDDAIQSFDREAKQTQDTSIRSFAQKALPELQSNLALINLNKP